MKREALSELHGYNSDGDVQLAKARWRESPSTNPELWTKEHEYSKAQQPLFSFSFGCDSKIYFNPQFAIFITLTAQQPDPLEHRTTIPTSLMNTTDEILDNIYHWIPAPSETDALEVISQPASKRSQRIKGMLGWSHRTTAIVVWLRTPGHMHIELSIMLPSWRPKDDSCDSPLLAQYPRILHSVSISLVSQPIELPTGILLEDKYNTYFHNALQNRSEVCLLVDLHLLIMPSAENQYIRGNQFLKDVIDRYNDSWLKTEPIYSPKPQPNHTQGLR